MRDKIFIFIALAFFLVAGVFIGVQLAPTKVVTKEITNKIIEKHNVIALAAVDSNNQGVIAYVDTQVRDGTGLVLVNINDILADYLTQYSARVAAQVAANYSKVNLSNLDVVYNIKANASVIGGPSAGAALSIASVALFQNMTLNKDVIITGTINEDGTIGEIGGVLEKGKAAKEHGFKLFLVPVGQGTDVLRYKEEKSCMNFDSIRYCEVRTIPEKTSISKEIGIETKEVKDLKEALDYLLEK